MNWLARKEFYKTNLFLSKFESEKAPYNITVILIIIDSGKSILLILLMSVSIENIHSPNQTMKLLASWPN